MTDRSVRILVVDHDDRGRRLHRELLEREGYLMAEAASGKDAISALQASTFDAMILELDMPDIDGFGVLDFIRRNRLPVRVVAVATPTPGGALKMAAYLGACATLDKRLSSDFLAATVRRALATTARAG